MLYDCTKPDERARGIAAAVEAVQRGDLVVMPTDAVYGIGADAFKTWAVRSLLNAKGRDSATPVLVGSRHTLDGLVYSLSPAARDLVEAFWPGALTIVVQHAPSLQWDLGDGGSGTVAVRMPLHPVALEVLRETGPMAVSSANKAGQPLPRTVEEAREQLGYAVSVYLESPQFLDLPSSTIVDLTGDTPRMLRPGAISLETLRTVVPEMRAPEEA
ncbi:L-threonylcarbamoyladenylate synthase [Planosporangium mesophilum]|uniref:L-threonylcarbamoyladenylate synthase n=1 Tax=Planosporangium mesophilum TaxID=689768 RepID=A0A8J3T7M6_9ACTN|nr:L-threonylcarbamoyladenylate synthase [Planosporangium mesophilum]NJC81520.1 threonylcarbamoyl-AMP synthase [Planosporangium mesophilum]GII20822.1 putative threonylcarbamoyl-AMP synthase [Planosporangium mesophilum]